MKNYYALITSDSAQVKAYEIFQNRIKENRFPLYLKTPYLNNIKKNDEVLFYLAGKNIHSQSFVAKSIIKEVEILKDLFVDADNTKRIVNKYLLFEDIIVFKKPKPIKPIIELLDFIRIKKNFGTYLVGGVVKLNDKDFNKILNS